MPGKESVPILNLTPSNKVGSLHSSRTIITIGGYNASEDRTVKWAVYDFNTSQDKYRAVVEEYNTKYEYYDLESAYSQRLSQLEQISNGEGPDIFYGSDYDYNSMGRANMVLDLLPYLEKDGVQIDSLTPNIRDLMIRDEHCYQLFSSYYVTGYFGRSSVFDDSPEVSIYDASDKSDILGIPLYCQLYAYDVCDMTLRYEVEEIIASGDIITADQMRDIVHYSFDYGVPDDYQLTDRATIDNVRNNEYLLCRLSVSDLIGYNDYMSIISNDLRFIGFPSINGSAHMMEPSGCMAISSGTDHPDACWELISEILSFEMQRRMVSYNSIPVNDQVLNEYIEACTDHETIPEDMVNTYTYVWAHDEISQTVADSYLEMIHSVDTVATKDWGLFGIIFDEISSRTLQGRTEDMIAESLLSRYNLYLDENYT